MGAYSASAPHPGGRDTPTSGRGEIPPPKGRPCDQDFGFSASGGDTVMLAQRARAEFGQRGTKHSAGGDTKDGGEAGDRVAKEDVPAWGDTPRPLGRGPERICGSAASVTLGKGG